MKQKPDQSVQWLLWGPGIQESFSFFFFFLIFVLIAFIFLKQFQFHNKIEVKKQIFSSILCPHTCTASPLINISTRGVQLLQLINLHRHLIITQSPQFILGFALEVVCCVGLDKLIMCLLLQYHTVQFNCPKNLLRSIYSTFPSPHLW